MNFQLFHPDFGLYETDNDVLIDRKLSMGYKFLDEVETEEPPKKKKGRPKKIIKDDIKESKT